MLGQAVKNDHPISDAFYLASVPKSRIAVVGIHIKNRRQYIGFFDVCVEAVFVNSFGFWSQVNFCF